VFGENYLMSLLEEIIGFGSEKQSYEESSWVVVLLWCLIMGYILFDIW